MTAAITDRFRQGKGRRAPWRRLLASACFVGTILPYQTANAEEESETESAFGPTRGTVRRIESPQAKGGVGGGVYGRFNGDLSLQIGAGAEAAFHDFYLRPMLTGDVTIYQTLGVYGSFRQAVHSSDPEERVSSLGLVLSPLFLVRWPRALETGAATWDLSVDSLALVAGLALSQPRGGSLFDDPGAELGLQFGIPLMGRANGLFLRSRAQVTIASEIVPAAWLWLSFQGFVHAGILNVDK